MGTTRWTMVALGFMTLISFAGLVAVFVRIDPAYADTGTFVLFYLSLFASVSGIATWVLMASRARLPKVKRPLRYFFHDAFRQGLLLGMIVSLSLFLQARRGLSLLWILLIVALAFAIEAYATRQLSRNTT